MKALLIIDVQNDFLPGGTLPVPNGDTILPIINSLQKKFPLVIASRDWHPANHSSFASNHEKGEVGQTIQINGLEQVLWPDHCVQGSPGAEFSPYLNQSLIQRVIHKGLDPENDSYSAFFDNGHKKKTGLDHYLNKKGVTDIYISGLATNVCVYYTVKDALLLGYNTWVITDATMGINTLEPDSQAALADMAGRGARLIQSEKL